VTPELRGCNGPGEPECAGFGYRPHQSGPECPVVELSPGATKSQYRECCGAWAGVPHRPECTFGINGPQYLAPQIVDDLSRCAHCWPAP
jgi:hypothetical protein